MSEKTDFKYFWEQPDLSFSIAGSGIMKEFNASGPNRFDEIYQSFEHLKKQTLQFNATDQTPGIHLLGGFSFFDTISDPEWQEFGAASFVVPKRIITQNNDFSVLSIGLAVNKDRTPERIHRQILEQLHHIQKGFQTQASENGKQAQPSDLAVVNNHRDQWHQSVLNARNAIAENRLEKVVLARQLRLNKQSGQQPGVIVDRLRSQYPNCSTFYIQKQQGTAFVGSSPETLLSFNGNSIQTEALAGSIGRGKTEAEDVNLSNELLASNKNAEEHHYVVQSIKQDLHPVVTGLTSSREPVIKKLANVQHLYTPLRAKKNSSLNPLRLLNRLHPTPAVGGFPREKAVAYIQQNEPFNRGWFASPVGWMNSNNEGEFTVAIRSGLIDETEATLFAGCGIVADSDPDNEWQETNLKFMPMLSALNYD